jgi:ELP3 family radical SAM enzyme/protein acetyltransferase
MTDIEDISAQKEEFISKKINDTLILFVKDLSSISYSQKKEVEDNIKLLRKKYHISPKKSQISFVYESLLSSKEISKNELLEEAVKAKAMRGLSGVIVISVITSPYPEYIDENGNTKKQRFSCKHDCFYCPREVDSNGKEINPRSYLSDEPTVARGLQHNFDAIEQYNDRARQYHNNGHYVDKIEIIVLGGTWTEYPREYQKKFIRDVFWAANTFYSLEKRPKLELEEEQKINETSNSRIIGLTLEMRPDSITDEEIYWLRNLGCTRVQLGVQHIDDTILKKVNRGCYYKDAVMALEKLKNNCFKVDAHWMPDLPGSSPEKDKAMFKHLLESSDLQFDQWKVYPTAVVPWTKIKKWYDKGEYIPYTDEDPENLINVLMELKVNVHPWIRLNRVVRDIPNKTRDGELYIYAGNKVTNLRQVIHDRLRKENKFCPCIRCREVKDKVHMIDEAIIVVRDYDSSNGKEYFISIESGNSSESHLSYNKWYNKDNEEEPGIIYGFIRLRLTSNAGNEYFPELKDSALVRELHVYGQVTSSKDKKQYNKKAQHKGFGKMLMNKAEEISLQNDFHKIVVISGIGVRKYYEKLGYHLENTFMVKEISKFNIIIIINLFLLFMNIYMFYEIYNKLYFESLST